MKILYVSTMPLEYSSSANMRNLALLSGLQKNGHELYLLTHEPQKDLQHYDNSLCNVNFKKKYLIKLGNIHSKATMKKNKKNLIKNLLYNILVRFKIYDFKSSIVKNVDKIRIDEKFDVIISSSDPKSSHLLAEKLIKLNPGICKKWIQYWGDPLVDDINNNKIILKSLIKKEELRVLKQCDKIIYVSPFTLEKQKELYPECANKMYFLPIPFNEKIFYKPTNNKQIKLGYFGDYYSRNRNILPLYNTMYKLKDKELNICGNSDVSLKQLDNIKIKGRLPLEQVRKLEEKSDLLICVCNNKGTQIPGKIYHYAATNKPILVLLDGDKKQQIKEYLESFNRFILSENKTEDIINTLADLKLEALNYDNFMDFDSQNIAKKFVEHI